MSLLLHAADAAHPFLTLADGVPNPAAGGGKPLPGNAVSQLTTILRYAFWCVTVLAVLGIITVAAKMITSHRQGGDGEHMSKLGMVLFGLILAGAASGIVNTII